MGAFLLPQISIHAQKHIFGEIYHDSYNGILLKSNAAILIIDTYRYSCRKIIYY